MCCRVGSKERIIQILFIRIMKKKDWSTFYIVVTDIIDWSIVFYRDLVIEADNNNQDWSVLDMNVFFFLQYLCITLYWLLLYSIYPTAYNWNLECFIISKKTCCNINYSDSFYIPSFLCFLNGWLYLRWY